MHLGVAVDAGVVVVNLAMPIFDVAAYTRYGLTRHEELVAYGPVWVVAYYAAFPHRLMFEHVRPTQVAVALEAFLVLSEHHWRSGTKQHCPSSSPHVTSVHIVAIAAKHFAFEHGMVVLEHELRLNIEMTGEACCFSVRPDDIVGVAARLDVQRPRAVAGFASLGLVTLFLFLLA